MILCPCCYPVTHLSLSASQTTHQDVVNGLQTELQAAQAAQEGLKQQLAEQEATIQQHMEQLQELQASITDLQSQLGETRERGILWGLQLGVCGVMPAVHKSCLRATCLHL